MILWHDVPQPRTFAVTTGNNLRQRLKEYEGMTKLDSFTRAYIECALWSSLDDEGYPLDHTYTQDDISPETLVEIVEDCRVFQELYATELHEAGAPDQNGHDYWLTRNHHGAGFWDRGYGEVGKRLTDAAEADGGIDLYVGDDGRIYV